MAMTSVRMPDDMTERLEQLAARLKRAKGWVITRHCGSIWSEPSTDSAGYEDTLGGIEALEAGETIDGDDVLTWLDSWGKPDELPPPE